MTPLVEVIREHLAQDASVERSVFGTDDAGEVAAYIDGFCVQQFGEKIVSGIFYEASTGCVAGVKLEGGLRIVVKAYQERWGERFLAGVGSVQGHLFGWNFPCPEPLVGVTHAGPALATAEAFLPDPGMRALESATEMKVSATGLAQLVSLCRSLSEPRLAEHPLQSLEGDLYPKPHSPIFDFSLDVQGAAWIDELAAAAQQTRALDTASEIIGHGDWSARNIRVSGSELVAAYDWDSLTLTSESAIVGQAAATWRSFGGRATPVAPDVQEVRDYISLYEAGAGRSFSQQQLQASLAAALWVLAYTARCEHALEAAAGVRIEHARARLITDGRSFLKC